ncbi:MAG: Fur family transcriptional regulator, partial [Mycobacteriales bacterium]
HGLTLDVVAQQLRATGTAADFSSVFRAVGHLQRQGLVVRVDFGDGATRYEVEGEHHEHVRCVDCGTVRALPGCLLEDVRDLVESATGFDVLTHSVVLAGRCPTCQLGGESPS